MSTLKHIDAGLRTLPVSWFVNGPCRLVHARVHCPSFRQAHLSSCPTRPSWYVPNMLLSALIRQCPSEWSATISTLQVSCYRPASYRNRLVSSLNVSLSCMCVCSGLLISFCWACASLLFEDMFLCTGLMCEARLCSCRFLLHTFLIAPCSYIPTGDRQQICIMHVLAVVVAASLS